MKELTFFVLFLALLFSLVLLENIIKNTAALFRCEISTFLEIMRGNLISVWKGTVFCLLWTLFIVLRYLLL